MTYQFVFNNSTILSGNIYSLICVMVLFIILVIILLKPLIIKVSSKISNNEVLKDEFITIIAHKFRTPLTSIKWILENRLTEEHDPFKRQNLVEIQKLNTSLIYMTGSLVEITDTDSDSKSSYNLEKTNLCDFVRTVSHTFIDLYHEKNITFSVSCAETNIMVNIDKQRMEFALQTLLENALIYSSPGKKVDVTVSSPRWKKAVITVTDNGIGIDQRDINKLFTKFYRTKNARKVDTEGLGIGLYLSKSIVRRHKGTIKAYSNGLNQGSAFEIMLRKVK